MRKQQQVAGYEPGSKPSPEHAGNFIFDFLTCVIVRNNVLLFQATPSMVFSYSSLDKLRQLSAPNAGQGVSNRNCHSLLVEMQNGTATLGKSLTVS